MKTAEFCCNCTSDLNLSSMLTSPDLKPLAKISQALSEIFYRYDISRNFGCNATENSETDAFLCSTCLLQFDELYYSKQSFLQKTEKNSLIGNLISRRDRINRKGAFDNYTENNENYFLLEEKRPNEINKNRPYNTPIYSPNSTEADNNEESILPDISTHNADDGIQSVIITEEKNSKSLELVELFPIVKVDRLCYSKVNGTNKKCIEDDLLRISEKQCKTCKRFFSETELLKNHYDSVHKEVERRYSCVFCAKKFHSEWFHKYHLKTFHGGIEVFHSCGICNTKFYSATDLQNHHVKFHDIRKHPLKCNRCLESFEKIFVLRKHLIRHHPGTWEAEAAVTNQSVIKKDKQKECPICKKDFSEFKEYHQHMKSAHESEELFCQTCDLKLLSYKAYTAHQKTHSNSLNCEKCAKSFPTHGRLKLHIVRVHGKKDRSCICEICGQRYVKFVLSAHYRWHSERSDPVRKHHCYICNRLYASKGSFSTHMQRIHSENPKRYQCEDCQEIFSSKWDLNCHLEKIHHKELLFPCKFCGKMFLDQKGASSHSRIHTQDEGYNRNPKLPSCGFIRNPKSQKSKLTEKGNHHEKVKVNIMSCFCKTTKRFVCPQCSRPSGWKSHFLRHLRTHSLISYTTPGSDVSLPATIPCPHCTLKFPRKDLLLRHFYRRHTKKVKPCNICAKEYQTKHILNLHMERHFVKISAKKGCDAQKDLNCFFSDESKVFKCSLCSHFVKNQNQFIKHHRDVHKSRVIFDKELQKQKNAELVKRAQCSQCNKKFWDTNSAKDHERSVHRKSKTGETNDKEIKGMRTSQTKEN